MQVIIILFAIAVQVFLILENKHLTYLAIKNREYGRYEFGYGYGKKLSTLMYLYIAILLIGTLTQGDILLLVIAVIPIICYRIGYNMKIENAKILYKYKVSQVLSIIVCVLDYFLKH